MDQQAGGEAWGWKSNELVLRLSGDDCLDWLQGQVTSDVRALTSSDPVNLCFCRSTGQIEAWARAFISGGDITMVAPKDCSSRIADRVQSYVICEDVAIVETNYSVLTIQYWQEPVKETPLANLVSLYSDFHVASYRSPGGGVDYLIAPEKISELKAALHFESCEQELESMRIASGTPEWTLDILYSTLPPELGPDFDANWVSYNKGCYLGQEVLMRIHSRGHTNWTWRLGCPAKPVATGDSVELNGKVVGNVTSAVSQSPYGPLTTVRIRSTESVQEGLVVKQEGVEIPIILQDFKSRKRQVRPAK